MDKKYHAQFCPWKIQILDYGDYKDIMFIETIKTTDTIAQRTRQTVDMFIERTQIINDDLSNCK